jgi:hypothetical protein
MLKLEAKIGRLLLRLLKLLMLFHKFKIQLTFLKILEARNILYLTVKQKEQGYS